METNEVVKFWQAAFWSPTKAVARLESGVMPRSERLAYFIVWSLIMVIGYEGTRYVGLAEPRSLEVLLSFVGIAGMVVPIFYFNHLHTTSTSFIEKYVVIYVAATFRIIFFIVIPYMIATMIAYAVAMPDIANDQLTYFDVVNYIGFIVLVTWYLGRFFKLGNKPQSENV